MYSKKASICIVLAGIFCTSVVSQNITNTIDTPGIEHAAMDSVPKFRLTYKNFIIPSIFIGYGVAGLTIDGLKQLNFSTRHEILEDKPGRLILDNYAQYIPAVLVYGLNAAGIKGAHNLKGRTIIYVTSQVISAAMVIPLKHIVKEERPDGSDHFSFPSGHTATAFSSAQFMFREYKDTNIWLSISGYSFAVFTGVYRTINNDHWVGDVVAGAGFGILSTELAYWLYPRINRLFGTKGKSLTTMIMPVYQHGNIGIGIAKVF